MPKISIMTYFISIFTYIDGFVLKNLDFGVALIHQCTFEADIFDGALQTSLNHNRKHQQVYIMIIKTEQS